LTCGTSDVEFVLSFVDCIVCLPVELSFPLVSEHPNDGCTFVTLNVPAKRGVDRGSAPFW
jgi:hypothetical protein